MDRVEAPNGRRFAGSSRPTKRLAHAACGEAKTLSFGAGGIRIVGRGR